MWFKQIQVFQITSLIPSDNDLEEQLEKIASEPCSSSIPFTAGWVAPIDEENEVLIHSYKNYKMICLQTEEKMLPAYVLRQELIAKIKHIEATQQRKVAPKEKFVIKTQLYSTLLSQAFSKISKIYAYFDTTNKRLILNTTNEKKTEVFLSMLQKTIEDLEIIALPIKNLTTMMTDWLQKDHCPKPLYIENACVLKEPRASNKFIRYHGQDLFSKSIKLFLQDGYQVDQITVTWQEHVTFVLKEKFSLSTIQYKDLVIAAAKEHYSETIIDHYIGNFIIMTEIVNLLINDLLKICEKTNNA